ncbi:MAG: fluoride efflux transporter CrcB [Deltaproteobacteria bacterium]
MKIILNDWNMVKMFFIVGLGSFLGGGSRYLVQQFFARQFPEPFPVGTLVVNIVGSLIIGIVFGLSERSNLLSNEMRIFLATGICGGFTTFSSFSIENYAMLKDGQYFYIFCYVGLSLFIGFLATFTGIQLIKIF